MSTRSSTKRAAAAAAAKKSPALPKARKVSAARVREREKVLLPSAYVKEIKQEADDSMSNVPGVYEEKEIKQESEILTSNAPEVNGVSPNDDEEKVVIREEVSVTTVVVEESKVLEETIEEKISDSEDPPILNTLDVEEGNNLDEENDDEMNENDNGGAHMNLDEGAKQDIVEEETAAPEIEDTKGGEDGNDTPGAKEGCTGEGDGEKSENYEEENEEDEDPSVYTHAPFTDRKKEKDFEIFVGGLDKGAVEDDLIKVFGRFGEIQAARIVKHPITNKSKGFAFIRYATVEQAKKALAELKDGTEVRGKRVGISFSQDNDTLYMASICKTWTKEHVLETLKSFGIEQIEEMYLPDDPKNEGKSKGFALLEFSTHSDAMAAFQRLRKPDAVFGCDISAKVAFAQTPIHPSEEALSQVKTVYVEGLTDSWDEEKVKEFCKQYGEIEKVQLSRNLVTKRNDFGFVAFTSRESAVACVEGINNAHIGEGDIKVKANLAKPHNKGRLQKQGARGGFKVKEDERTEEAGPSKMKGHAKSKEGERKVKALPKLKTAKGGKPYKPQCSVTEGQGTGVSSRSERTNRQRNELPAKGEKRGRRDTNTGYSKRPLKKPRGDMRDRPSNGSGNQMNNSRFGKARPSRTTSATYGNPYTQGYAGSASSYQGLAYAAVSGSKRRYSDMEPHAGYLEPASGKQGQDQRGCGLRRAGGYDGQGRSGVAYGGSVLPPFYALAPNYASYIGYEGSGSGGGYYPSSGAYPPRQAYY